MANTGSGYEKHLNKFANIQSCYGCVFIYKYVVKIKQADYLQGVETTHISLTPVENLPVA